MYIRCQVQRYSTIRVTFSEHNFRDVLSSVFLILNLFCLKLIEEKGLKKDEEIAEFCSGYLEASDTPLILALKLCSGVVFRYASVLPLLLIT